MRCSFFWDIVDSELVVTDFRDKVWAPSSRVKKVKPIRCPETSVIKYQLMPRNIPEERRYELHCGRSLKALSLPKFGIGIFTASP
jgi:hypothetical protein